MNKLIWLVDYDGKIENLALMHLSAYHKAQGDTVRLKFRHATPELFEMPDKVYISCLFRWNRRQALALADAWGNKAEIGGTGINIKKRLSEEVENCRPDYFLYGDERAIGFISRGCIRRCPWCVVPEKEGKLKRASTAQEIVNGRQSAIFLDNNFLALPDHHSDLVWLAENQIKIDFNQGLDARLINDNNAILLAACAWSNGSTVRIALDSTSMIPSVERAIDCLIQAGLSSNSIFVYCLIGFGNFDDDVKRLLFLREKRVRAFPMGYRDLETGKEPMAGWNPILYRKYRRLICRLPHAQSVWEDFKRDVKQGRN